MKKKYKLRKEVVEFLEDLVGIIVIGLLFYMLFILNTILF